MKEAIPIATNESNKRTRHAAPAAGGEKKPTKAKKAKKGGFGRVMAFLFKFIFVCGCLGVMAVSAVAVVMVNYVVEATANDNLDLDKLTQSQSSTVYAFDADTQQWIETAQLKSTNSHRLQVDLEQIPEDLQWAFICTEDKDFYNEPGVNIKRTVAAMINEYIFPILPSKQGASTIEQQLIKNILDDKASSGIDGALRKLREIFRAFGLYKNFSKPTILEAYLNTISFTGTIQGVQTAADEYFNKDVSELNLQECAVIASITKAPRTYDPYNNPENLLERRNHVLWNMYDQGKITQAEYDAAKNSPLVLTEEHEDETDPNATTVTSYFDDALYEELVLDFMEAYDWTREQASNYIYTGGLSVYSTMDPDIQTSMEKVMLNADDKYFPAGWTTEEVKELAASDIPVYESDGVTLKTETKSDGSVVYFRKVRTQAAMATVDYDGKVLALVGGVGEKTTNRSLNRAYSVARQTGSSIKPLTCYSLGIEYGLYNYSSMLLDTPLYTAEMEIIKNEKGNGYRDWPRNYGGTYTQELMPVYMALAKSTNTIAAWVGDTVGQETMYTFAKNTLQMNNFVESDANLGAMCMGSQSYGATPMQMAAAFQIFKDGTYTTPHLYTEVYDSDGNLVLEADTTGYQALTEETATIMNRMLYNVTSISGGTGARLGGKVAGHPAVGKTGTASDERDLWFVGATPYYVTSVWWGYDDPKDLSEILGTAKTSTCIDAWKAYMSEIHQDLEVVQFPVAEEVEQKRFCIHSGLLASPVCAETAVGYYLPDSMPDMCDYGY